MNRNSYLYMFNILQNKPLIILNNGEDFLNIEYEYGYNLIINIEYDNISLLPILMIYYYEYFMIKFY